MRLSTVTKSKQEENVLATGTAANIQEQPFFREAHC